ncbi:tetratricopeptide repeat protein, partial [Candidatus Omnitrophota bacterium]
MVEDKDMVMLIDFTLEGIKISNPFRLKYYYELKGKTQYLIPQKEQDFFEKVFSDLPKASRLKYRYMSAGNSDNLIFSFYLNLGSGYEEKGLLDMALTHYEAARKINPNNAGILNNLGSVYLKQFFSDGTKQFLLDKAIEQFKIAIDSNPDLPDAYYNLGFAYLYKGLLDEAAKEFNVALGIDPDLGEAYLGLGRVYYEQSLLDKAYEQGLLDKAIEQLNTAIRINPDLAAAYNDLGAIYYDQGLLNKAIKQLNAAIDINPDLPEAHYNLGRVYYVQNLLDKAIEQFEIALNINPEYVEARKGLNLALAEKSKRKNNLVSLKDLVEKDSFKEALDLLRTTEVFNGDKAIKTLIWIDKKLTKKLKKDSFAEAVMKAAEITLLSLFIYLLISFIFDGCAEILKDTILHGGVGLGAVAGIVTGRKGEINLSLIQEKILNKIREKPGLTRKELAGELGYITKSGFPQEKFIHSLYFLTNSKLIKKLKVGRENRYYLKGKSPKISLAEIERKILIVLQNKRSGLRRKEIEEKTGLSRATVYNNVCYLENKGLVRTNKKAKKPLRVFLTPKGKKALSYYAGEDQGTTFYTFPDMLFKKDFYEDLWQSIGTLKNLFRSERRSLKREQLIVGSIIIGVIATVFYLSYQALLPFKPLLNSRNLWYMFLGLGTVGIVLDNKIQTLLTKEKLEKVVKSEEAMEAEVDLENIFNILIKRETEDKNIETDIDIFRKYYIEHYTYKEISEEDEISEQDAGEIIKAIKKKLIELRIEYEGQFGFEPLRVKDYLERNASDAFDGIAGMEEESSFVKITPPIIPGVTIGETIKYARKRTGLSQEKLGELIGVSTLIIDSMEHNRHAIGMETLDLLAEHLKIDVEEFPILLVVKRLSKVWDIKVSKVQNAWDWIILGKERISDKRINRAETLLYLLACMTVLDPETGLNARIASGYFSKKLKYASPTPEALKNTITFLIKKMDGKILADKTNKLYRYHWKDESSMREFFSEEELVKIRTWGDGLRERVERQELVTEFYTLPVLVSIALLSSIPMSPILTFIVGMFGVVSLVAMMYSQGNGQYNLLQKIRRLFNSGKEVLQKTLQQSRVILTKKIQSISASLSNKEDARWKKRLIGIGVLILIGLPFIFIEPFRDSVVTFYKINIKAHPYITNAITLPLFFGVVGNMTNQLICEVNYHRILRRTLWISTIAFMFSPLLTYFFSVFAPWAADSPLGQAILLNLIYGTVFNIVWVFWTEVGKENDYKFIKSAREFARTLKKGIKGDPKINKWTKKVFGLQRKVIKKVPLLFRQIKITVPWVSRLFP